MQYERYHTGDPVRVMAGLYTSYDTTRCDDLVARALQLSKRAFEQAKARASVAAA